MKKDQENLKDEPDFNSGMKGNYTLIGVNSLEGGFGATDESIDMAVLDMGINMSETFIPADIETLFEQSISQLLDAFATNRGYATSLTAADITDYVEAAMKYYSLIVASWRAENASNLRTARGTNVSSMFRNRHAMATPTQVLSGAPVVVRADNNGGAAISNAAWLRENVIYLQDVFLPSNVLRFLFGLFSGVYSLDNYSDGGNTSLLMIHPGSLNESDSVQVRARAAGVTLNALSSTPDMISFLKFMGWSNEEAIGSDLTRDLHGNTLVIYDDPALLEQLINAKALTSFDLGVTYGSPALDDDIRDLYFDPTDEYGTAFMYRDRKEFNADDFMLAAMFHRGLVPNPTLSIYELATYLKVLASDSVAVGNNGWPIISPIRFTNAGPNLTNGFVLGRIGVASGNWALFFNIPTLGIPTVAVSTDVSGLVTGYAPISLTSLVGEGPNVFYINNDDMTTYREIAWLRFLLGEDYRRWLQLSISRSITSRLGEK